MTHFGEREPLAFAIEERKADFRFHLAYHHAHRRLREVQALGGAGEAAAVDRGGEGAQLLEADVHQRHRMWLVIARSHRYISSPDGCITNARLTPLGWASRIVSVVSPHWLCSMPLLTFITPNGSRYEAHVAGGDTLLRAAMAHGIPDLYGICGGACCCASCHVYVEAGPGVHLPPVDEMEAEMLDL